MFLDGRALVPSADAAWSVGVVVLPFLDERFGDFVYCDSQTFRSRIFQWRDVAGDMAHDVDGHELSDGPREVDGSRRAQKRDVFGARAPSADEHVDCRVGGGAIELKRDACGRGYGVQGLRPCLCE